MPLGMVSGVGRGMGVLDRGRDRRRGRGSFGVELGLSHCTHCGLCDVALPILLWAVLVTRVLLLPVITFTGVGQV